MRNQRYRVLLTYLFIAPFFLASCSKAQDSVPDKPVPIALTGDQTSLIGSENAFAFDLFKKVLAGAGENENVIISPLSISYALSMTVNGAAGATRDSMLKALRLNSLTVEKINDSYKKLTEALLTVDKRVLISIANSVWTEKDFEVKKAFIDILTQYYNSESQTFDISDPDTPDRINAWIDGKTNHLIKNMIDRLDNNTVMLLINAIYFKGKWASQFDPSKTGQKPFYESGGTVVNVPMMKQEADFKVYEGSGFDVAEFPYGQGNFVMDVIVPHERNGLSSILPSITDPNFSSWIKAMTSKKTDLSMPKFKYGYKKKMKEILSGMGMGIAFYEGADFSNISDRANLCISDVTHQAFIETNEEGTEAAAATVVGIVLTSMPQVFTLNLDHPFVYIIRETTTNSILFMGVVADPSAA